MKTGLRSDKNSNYSLEQAYKSLTDMFKAVPEYRKDILETIKTALQSDKNITDNLREAYESLSDMFQAAPEYRKDIFETMKTGVQSDKNDGLCLAQAYKSLSVMFQAVPEYRKDIFETMKTGLQSDKNDDYSLEKAYKSLSDMFQAAPEYRKDILETMKTGLQSDKNSRGSYSEAYFSLYRMFENVPEYRKDILETMKAGLQSDKNNGDSLSNAYASMDSMFQVAPEYRKDILETMKTLLQSDINKVPSIIQAYESLSDMFQSAPEYRTDILETMKKTMKTLLQSDKNKHFILAKSYESLDKMFRAAPEYGKDILETMETGLKSDQNNYSSLEKAYESLSDMFQAVPEYGKDILETMKTGLQSDKNDDHSLEKAYDAIKQIAETNADLHEEILNTIISLSFADKDKINLASICLQNVEAKNLDNVKAQYHNQESLLQAAYNIRSCDESEKTCLANNFSISQLIKFDSNTYKKAKNAILDFEYLSQKSTETNNGEPLSKEQLLQQNQDWLIPNAAALSLVYGNDFQNYLQKIAVYNKYLQARKAEIGTEKDAKRQAQREAKAAELTTNLRINASKIQLDSKKVDELNQRLEQLKTNGTQTEIIEAQKAYDEARTALAADQRKQGSLAGTLKSVVGYVDYANMQPISAEKATAWMLQVSKLNDASEVRKCADKHMFGETPEHDKFIRFDMPNVKTEYNEETGQCIRTGQKNTDDLSMVLQRYDMLKEHIANKKFVEIAAMAKALKWAGRDQEFCLSNAEFLSSQQKYNEAESIYLQGKATPSAFADKEMVYSTDGTWRCFVAPKDDPRPICAGGNFGSKRASCCQSYGSVGSECAVDSVINPDSGCLIFEKKDKSGNREMLGCSWFYRTQNQDMKNLTFDNVEINNSVYKQDAKQIQEVFSKMVDQFKNDNYRQITIGSSPDLMLDSSKYNLANNKAPLPDGYSGYSDAATQWLLYDNPQATPEKLPELLICGYSEKYKHGAEQVAQQCFPESDKELSVPKNNPQGMVLTDRQGKVCGYCLWDETEKHIYDMAVLPEYRKDQNKSSFKLLVEVTKYIKRAGGEWSANLRDKTTLHYMEVMQQRGLVTMKKNGTSRDMINNKGEVDSKVIDVTFKPIIPEQNKTNTSQQTISTNKGGRA